MATLAQLRDGLKTRLATISGLHAYDVLPEVISVPAAIVRPLSGEYRGSLSGSPTVKFEILILVQASKINSAQDALDPYLSESGASSVFAAIEADRTLSSNCDDVLVSGWRDYGGIQIAGVEYLSARIDMEVYQ